MTTYNYYLPPPRDIPTDAAVRPWAIAASTWIHGANQGKINATTSLTLTAGATSTTLQDPRLTANSYVSLAPKSANARAATWYLGSQSEGQCVVQHTSTSTSDCVYTVLIIG